MIWPADSVLRFHCQRALNGTERCYFVYEVSILKLWAIYELGGGVLSIETIQSVCRTERDRI